MKESNRKKYPREYRIWKGMRARCYAPCNIDMGNYQKHHIKVCDRWNSFDSFIEDMGKAPDGYTIDRIDSSKDYCPENCRWASWSEQAKNRGKFTPLFELYGKKMVLKDWAREYNIDYTTLRYRIFKLHLPLKDALVYVDPRKTRV